MSSTLSETEKIKEELCDQEEVEQNPGLVTTHLYLKPTHTSGTLDKEVVLRRIRHRKRANKVKSAVGALFTWPSAAGRDNSKNSVPPQIRWADDAFAAP